MFFLTKFVHNLSNVLCCDATVKRGGIILSQLKSLRQSVRSSVTLASPDKTVERYIQLCAAQAAFAGFAA